MKVSTKEMNLHISVNDRSFILNLLSHLPPKFVQHPNRVNIYKLSERACHVKNQLITVGKQVNIIPGIVFKLNLLKLEETKPV